VTKSEKLARVPPVYRLARAWRDRRHALSHAPTRAKRDLLRTTASAHGMRVLVETGTYTGETAWAMRRRFDRIETIELEPTLARLARIRFARTPNVHVHEGDSAALLPRILGSLDQPTLFWLDAHPSTDRAVRDTPVPLLAELAAIAGNRVGGHVILIDDMRYMGSHGYPAEDELAPAGYRLEQIGDVGLLVPDAQPSRE
jgi:predicted O-methyltransferase YrrM